MYRVKMVWINRMRWVCNFWGFQEDQWFVDSSHSRTFQDLVKKWEKLVSYLNRKTLSNLNKTTSSGDAGYSTLSHLFMAIYLYACQRLYYMEDTSFCLKLSRCPIAIEMDKPFCHGSRAREIKSSCHCRKKLEWFVEKTLHELAFVFVSLKNAFFFKFLTSNKWLRKVPMKQKLTLTRVKFGDRGLRKDFSQLS